jgi:cytoskeletal protein RodZ
MLDTTVPPEPQPEVRERRTRRPVRRRDKSEQDAALDAARAAQDAQAGDEIASSQPTGVSPIGQLSTAGGDANAADRNTITNQINATENTLNSLHRHMSSGELKIVAQIRTFITRAREALRTNDLDGARTLSTKAHVLLDELVKG